jgi:trk system potassium uptake protein TrkH
LFSGVYRTIAFVNGLFCLYLAFAMLAPMVVDLIDDNPDWQGFLVAALGTGSLSTAIILANRGGMAPFSPRMGFLLVISLWFSTSLVSALPFLLGARDISVTDAIFESVSGLTTTGATILTGLDDMPRGLLLWRSIMQWFGGIGIVAMGLILMPYLRIGGMQFFRMESSERSDKPVARIQTFAVTLATIYLSLTLACLISYRIGGMNWFDALNHSMTTLSTGGFATTDSSFASYGDGVVLASTIFMLAGALPFTAFFRFVLTGQTSGVLDNQIPVLFLIVILLTIPVFVSAVDSGALEPGDALLHSAFNVVSIVTTTGYATTDYTTWGALSVAVFLVATFVGGCAGSTSGGFKTYRLIILFQTLRVSVRELIYPSGVFPVYYNGRRINADGLRSVTTFFFAYVAILFLFTVLLSATGLDLVTAMTGTLTSLSNVGPGLGPVIGPAGNFSTLPDMAKWLCVCLMILGRLEIMTILVVLNPLFWRGN